jgi:low density lipoprotein receptor-related protein 5/6
MYWTDTLTNKIQRANLDGSNVTDLITGLNNPRGIALNLSVGLIYWTNLGNGTIQSANLADGSNIQTLVSGLSIPSGVAIIP